ncbi:MAG: amidohydrolase family protein [Planctomycetota bacterium]
MRIRSRLPITLSLALLALAARPRSQDRPLLLKGGRVFTGSGSFQEGLEILIEEGKLKKVGKSLAAPENAEVRDLEGLHVTPGLIDGNTSLGLPSPQENEQSSEITPHMRVLDSIDPESRGFEHALRDGVTTVYVSPGGYNVFGGLGIVIKTAGPSLEDRVIREDADLRMTLGRMPGMGNRAPRYGTPTSIYYRRPTNRMGTIWEIRKAFYDADKARGSKKGVAEPGAATQVLIDALDHKLKVRTTARQDQDIRTALRLAEEFGIDVVIDECTEAYYALDYIAAAKVPVIAAPPSVHIGRYDGEVPHPDTLKLLSEAGVQVAIQTGQGLGALPLVREAGFAVRGGMQRDKALESITSVPALILGVEDRVGSIAEGKDADLVVWSRHPLSPSSRAVAVYIDGQPRIQQN